MKKINILIAWITSWLRYIFKFGKNNDVVIWTLPHTLYIAHLMYMALQSNNPHLKIKIMHGKKIKRFNKDFYFIVCPQVLKKMPPFHKTVSIQLEQCVSDWFDQDYFLRLKNSKYIYDYSKSNIDYLLTRGLAADQINYFPISAILNYKSFLFERYNYRFDPFKKNDILFYGNLNSPRRQRLLNVLSNNFNVRIEESLYGYDMLQAINESKIIINLHYYESALLETTRIYECLSMGACVVSESSVDLTDYPHLMKSTQISFFNINDEADMIKKVQSMLIYNNTTQDIRDVKMLEESQHLFQEQVGQSLKKIIS